MPTKSFRVHLEKQKKGEGRKLRRWDWLVGWLGFKTVFNNSYIQSARCSCWSAPVLNHSLHTTLFFPLTSFYLAFYDMQMPDRECNGLVLSPRATQASQIRHLQSLENIQTLLSRMRHIWKTSWSCSLFRFTLVKQLDLFLAIWQTIRNCSIICSTAARNISISCSWEYTKSSNSDDTSKARQLSTGDFSERRRSYCVVQKSKRHYCITVSSFETDGKRPEVTYLGIVMSKTGWTAWVSITNVRYIPV